MFFKTLIRWGFRTDRVTKEQGLCEKKTESKYFAVQTEQTRLIRHLLYGFWFIFFSVYNAVFVFRCCRLPYLWVSWFRFMFTLVRHSFASLINKQLSRKATLIFQDVLLFELFQRTLLNPFLYSFKSTFWFDLNQLFPVKTYRIRKKAYYPHTAPGRAIRFFPDLSATNQRAPITMKTSLTI